MDSSTTITHSSLVELGKQMQLKSESEKRQKLKLEILKEKFEQTKLFNPNDYVIDFIRKSKGNTKQAPQILTLISHIKVYKEVYEHQHSRINLLKNDIKQAKVAEIELEKQISTYLNEIDTLETEKNKNDQIQKSQLNTISQKSTQCITLQTNQKLFFLFIMLPIVCYHLYNRIF